MEEPIFVWGKEAAIEKLLKLYDAVYLTIQASIMHLNEKVSKHQLNEKYWLNPKNSYS